MTTSLLKKSALTTALLLSITAAISTLVQAAPRPLSCPDLAAQQIQFELIRRSSPFRGFVRITGVIRNVGLVAYSSRPGQQVAYLYEQNPGEGAPRLVAERPFTNLAPGREVRVSFERNWDGSSPAEGEFPPTYKLLIGYDPDIYQDGNPKNDDCNRTNNQRERSGSDINSTYFTRR
jgi:hypothetical protein